MTTRACNVCGHTKIRFTSAAGVDWCGYYHPNGVCLSKPVRDGLGRVIGYTVPGTIQKMTVSASFVTRRQLIEVATGVDLDKWGRRCGNGPRSGDSDEEYRERVLRNFDSGGAQSDDGAPITERSMPVAAPYAYPTINPPVGPCKIAYYGIDCTGCEDHPRGLSVDDVRRMRRMR